MTYIPPDDLWVEIRSTEAGVWLVPEAGGVRVTVVAKLYTSALKALIYHGASAYFLVSAVPVGNLWATFVGVRVDDDTAPQVASGILASEAQQFRLQRLLRHSEIRTHFFDEASEGLAYLGG